MSVPRDEYDRLIKTGLHQELEEQMKTWFGVFVTFSGLAGFFGVRALVREMVSNEFKEASRASARAEMAAQRAEEAIKEGEEKINEEVRRVKAVEGEVKRVDVEARRVDDEFKELSSRIAEERAEIRSRIDAEGARTYAQAELKIRALDQQLAELRDVVTKIASDSQNSRGALAELAEFEKRRSLAEESAASTQADFAANSAFRVLVVHHGFGSKTGPLGPMVVEALSKLGFKASEATWEGGTALKDSVEIDYKERARDKAELVRATVEDVLAQASTGARTMALVKSPEADGEDDKDIRVFLGTLKGPNNL